MFRPTGLRNVEFAVLDADQKRVPFGGGEEQCVLCRVVAVAEVHNSRSLLFVGHVWC